MTISKEQFAKVDAEMKAKGVDFGLSYEDVISAKKNPAHQRFDEAEDFFSSRMAGEFKNSVEIASAVYGVDKKSLAMVYTTVLMKTLYTVYQAFEDDAVSRNTILGMVVALGVKMEEDKKNAEQG